MWWQEDDLADKLIANNTARPIPGMEKPDMARLGINGAVRRKTSMPADEVAGHPDGERKPLPRATSGP